jgi:hypothetical protein
MTGQGRIGVRAGGDVRVATVRTAGTDNGAAERGELP